MSVFEAELKRRLARGDDVGQVAEWYIKCCSMTPEIDATASEFVGREENFAAPG